MYTSISSDIFLNNGHCIEIITFVNLYCIQVYHDSEEGTKFRQFYKVTDWPYVAIIDPRTGILWCKFCVNCTFSL